MSSPQTYLLKPADSKHQQPHLVGSSGPVFEFGPGWGAKSKQWLKKYILGGNCTLCRTVRYVMLFAFILLILLGPRFQSTDNSDDSSDKESGVPTKAVIAETVIKGDSKIALARRVLTDYLSQFPDSTLTNGRKVYIETVLGQKISSGVFHAGASIEFLHDDIKFAIENSKLLSPSQLKRWEKAAKKVKF